MNMGKQLGNDLFVNEDLTDALSQREQACPIKRVLDADSRQVVGWLYQWNTGQLALMWKDERCKNVVYE